LAKGPVLFVCVENAERSQMAEAFAKKLGMNAVSAGTIPSTRINPTVVDAMRERGIGHLLQSSEDPYTRVDPGRKPRCNNGLLHPKGVSETDYCSDAEEAGRVTSRRPEGQILGRSEKNQERDRTQDHGATRKPSSGLNLRR